METGWEFWIDRGGTFTDIVARSPAKKIFTYKLLSENPQHYQDAALQGIQVILDCYSEDPASEVINSIKMGTTVGTNALLERKGEPVALLINTGLKDCLRIGYQNRPDIFALNIRRPEQLYKIVVEIDCRTSASGNVLHELDIAQLELKLSKVYDQGIRAIAVVLMHAWRDSKHEQLIAEVARNIGFTQISLSHQVSALPKMIERGDTTVLDAYLSPVLRRYVGQIEQGMKDRVHSPRLFFMQSNGGLVKARGFHGKDCILSGPAGGIIGAINVAKRANLPKIIAFDMGGTSTDVAHCAGELERTSEIEITGIHLRTPMMNINTVAAGGGSILHFDGFRYRVGPDSAGANPGPACYRQGGPLTVTDANLMLGKLPFFPSVFGTENNLPPDLSTVQHQFKVLSQVIFTATGDIRSPEQVAEGFLTIAIENMAEAIKKISVQKGYHLADYTLCCYGAAGGQHACLLADRLGMASILLHPLAGVLSAYGMGLADCRILKEQAWEENLAQIHNAQLMDGFKALELRGRAELIAQGFAAHQIVAQWRLALRFQGTDTSLTLDYGEPSTLQQRYDSAYRQRFGFCYQDRAVIVSSVQVECIAVETEPFEGSIVAHDSRDIPPESTCRCFTQNRWQQAQVYRRDCLPFNKIVTGPCIIIEAISTIVIEPGWQGQLQRDGNLLLTRCQQAVAQDISATQADPVLLEVFNKRFMSIAEQMGFVLQNTAQSVNIKERLDFSCAIFNADGELIANAPHIPVHLGSMGESVQALLQSRSKAFKSGDVYLLNSPYAGGTHLPDITVVTPMFDENNQNILFFVASRGHHADIGGISPGSMPAHSRHISEEGVLSEGLRIVEQGQFLEAVVLEWLHSNPIPARNPLQNLGDLQAQIAANQKGVQALQSLICAYSLPVVLAYMQHVQNHAEACVRNLVKTLKAGYFEYPLEQHGKIAVTITINHEQGEACIDFTGTSPAADNNFNAPSAVCKAAVLYVFRTLMNEDIALNSGCLKPLMIRIPDGSLLNPFYPAAVAAGNVETSQYIVDALYGALGVLAASQGTMNNFTFGNAQYQYYETICGGAGAGSGFNGADAVHTHMTNSRITDPEILEMRFPVTLKEFSIRQDSGGKGRYRGGNGVVRCLEFNEPMTAVILSSHRILPALGLQGGFPGLPGINRLRHTDSTEELLPACVEIQVKAGDSIIIETPGGGGYGSE